MPDMKALVHTNTKPVDKLKSVHISATKFNLTF